MPHAVDDYAVGWICAIRTEYIAAREFLDEEHEPPEAVSPHDNNAYTLGRIGEHNVVIAVLPNGEYGISSAATVARDMMHSFCNIRFGLMVGIGGGAPSPKHDIRLGDIVVSAPRDGKGGIFQYDLGKTIQDQTFRPTGFLNQPPTILRTAVTVLDGIYEADGHHLEENIQKILRKKPRLRKNFRRPESSSDRLYQSKVTHPIDNDLGCVAACGVDQLKLIQRPSRTEDEDNPAVHYGVIASGNQLMKHALVRDKLATEEGILCFEMEAAGLMNHFPCLIIRGICDYSDSHKSKEWQGYAAMAAAAYAKDLLHRIPGNRVKAEQKINSILSDVHKVSKEHLDIGKRQLQAQNEFTKERLLDKEARCHQLFRLTTSRKDATYEWYKDRVEERVKDTCLWFLNHEHFQKWLEQESGPLLVTADPGCGKSVLAKYLVDHGLPRSTTICYFFFKDQDQNTIRQALCALLHQLFSQRPSLIEHAMPQYVKDGEGLIHSTESLWTILQNSIKDPQAGSVIIVFDALDECEESEFAHLIRKVEAIFYQMSSGKLKCLLTCRPYQQILSKFRGLLGVFPNIRIPGEEESEAISQEVNRVITYRVNQLPTKDQAKNQTEGLSPEIKCHLEKKLKEATHRTYLWVYLVFNYLEREDFKKTIKGVDSTLGSLPKSINEAYDQILNKSTQHVAVRKALSFILAAYRPLTLSEMNVAMNMDGKSQSFCDLDLEDDENFKLRLRSLCGLFISIHHGKIYFLHQTAREFLQADLALTTIPTGLSWHHSITLRDAHRAFAEICVAYLNFFDSDRSEVVEYSDDRRAFLGYSATYWGAHFREAGIVDDIAIVPFAERLCDPDSKSYSEWFSLFELSQWWRRKLHFTNLMVASYMGLQIIVKLLLENGTEIEARDDAYEYTSLLWAARMRHEAVVDILLTSGAEVNVSGKDNCTPLTLASMNGQKGAVKLLLENGAEVDARDDSSLTPLLWATGMGDEAVVKLLLEEDAEVDGKSKYHETPLWKAAENGHEKIAKLLLDAGAGVDVKDNVREFTPLLLAVTRGHIATTTLLLEYGAGVEVRDRISNITPLLGAAMSGHIVIAKLLLEKGAEVEAKGHFGLTALLWAAEQGHEALAMLLLDSGADVEATDEYGITSLLRAAQRGHEIVTRLLLQTGAEVEARDDKYGRTPLLSAVKHGYEATTRLLLEAGADTDVKDNDGITPLMWATMNRDDTIVKLLLEAGADTDVKDNDGITPLTWATMKRHDTIAKLLLEAGADTNVKDNDGITPLTWATMKRHDTIVKLMLEAGAKGGQTPLWWTVKHEPEATVRLQLEQGADVEEQDDTSGRTSLIWAAQKGNTTVVKLLLEKGAEIEAKDRFSWTSLLLSAEQGHEISVQLLLDSGADAEARDDKTGQTPLLWAIQNEHTAVVKLLLHNGANVEREDYSGLTPLLLAAKLGNETIVQQLLNHGAQTELGSDYGFTPLLWAAAHENKSIVQLLLNNGAKTEVKDCYGRTPLFWATEHGNEAIIQLLLEAGANAEAKDKKGIPLLLWAVNQGYIDVTKLLLHHGAKIEEEDMFGCTPLLQAAKRENEAIIRLLLEAGANIEAKDDEGRTPLWWAINQQHIAVVKLLLAAGADVEANDNYGFTPLLWAAGYWSIDIVKLLLEKGASLEAKDKCGRTPLLRAVAEEHEAVVELLLEAGSEVDAKDFDYGLTSLLLAVERGSLLIVKKLLEKKADVKVADSNNWTPLFLATERGHTAIVNLLLKKGIEFDSRDKYGWTPLMWAAACGHQAIIKLLLKAGAKVEVKDENGITPLSLAAEQGSRIAVKLLLDNGANVEAKDNGGRTPLSWAVQMKHEAAIKLLRQHSP
ncbi:hypothetical protein QQS21_000949 [Conoideocrella luteorostrata]|uniref:Nucleoside phosphorylase domain-containing protein n=1 Tax=Conoideocrella luteorostrata TaxID=1105319 RepID=A0AAJ0G278_9HYPO|nr:hypothetical protein QQS21_000949 [Conoideocrella luteorostrata]